MTWTGRGLVHPALIPGIGIEHTRYRFGTNAAVFGVSGLLIALVILWAVIAPGNISDVGNASLSWVTSRFGWMYGILAIGIFLFMMVLGYGRAGGVRLGPVDV